MGGRKAQAARGRAQPQRAGGGYLLSKPPESITLAAILRVLDGPIAPVPCLSKTAYRRCDGCQDEATCAVRLVLREAYGASVEVLERTKAPLGDRKAQVAGALTGPLADGYKVDGNVVKKK